MADDTDSKTEQPSARRLNRAHEEGDVFQSHEVKTAAMLLAGLAVVWIVMPMLMNRLAEAMIPFLARAGSIRIDTVGGYQTMIADTIMRLTAILAIPFGLFILVALVASLAQTGWVFTTTKLGSGLDKLSPMAGLRRLFGVQALVELAKNILKIAVIGAIAVLLIRPRFDGIERLTDVELGGTLAFLHRLLILLMATIVALMLMVAAADWIYQRFTFMRRMRMTKQEVKDEQKQTEGDPMVKARLRSLRIQRARQRMMQAVPMADVVVTNPTHYACALKYEAETMNAPVLVAKGQDLIAIRIRQIAEENEVPVVENPPLARALYATVELDKEIPPEHYKAVAEVISYVFRLKGKLRH